MWNKPDVLPAQRSIFLVRKWVSKSHGAAVSFVAKRPDKHMQFMAPSLEFEPELSVVVGSVRNGQFFDEYDGVDDSLDIEAILAWTAVPDEFLKERDVAHQAAADLILKVSR